MKRMLPVLTALLLAAGMFSAGAAAVNDGDSAAPSAETAVQQETGPAAPAETLPADEPADTAPAAEPEPSDEALFPEMPYIGVEDIALSDFKEIMYTEETQTVSATVFPSDATEHELSYFSTVPGIASVNRSGVITGHAAGKCRIGVSCGGVTLYQDLTVRVKTTGITLNTNYAILKPKQSVQITAQAVPAEAAQTMRFKSGDTAVAVVDENGCITAAGTGNTTVLVTNEDYITYVNVIVNTAGSEQEDKAVQAAAAVSPEDQLADRIRDSGEDVIAVSGVQQISPAALRALYGTEKKIVVDCGSYALTLNGRDISNAERSFDTNVDISDTEQGIEVNLGTQRILPGKTYITLKEHAADCKYLYIRNQSGVWQKLEGLSDGTFAVSSTGRYLLTRHRMDWHRPDPVWILCGFGVLTAAVLIYIVSKKRYWFW